MHPQILDIALSVLKDKIDPRIVYHSPEHTIDVYQSAERIARHENLSDAELEALLTASAFHDTGYAQGMLDHERKSVEIFLNTGIVPMHCEIELICELILATQVHVEPKNRLEAIIKDADLDYLGREDFEEKSNLLFEEFKYIRGLMVGWRWLDEQIRFLESHSYYTEFSLTHREPVKQQNLENLRHQRATFPN